MRVCHVLISMLVLLSGTAALAAPPPKPRASKVVLQLQAQIAALTAERDDLTARLAATASLQEDLAAAQKSRDLARDETEAIRKELDQMKSTLADNQGSADTILAELAKTKADLAAALASNESLRTTLEANQQKLSAPVAEGALVPVTPDITPARAMNLNRVTPKARKVTRGVVVVNVLVSENGEVLDSRLLQGLPGNDEWTAKANAACVEQAKRLVFDPARAADGTTKVRVWQGVGFLIY
jgi:hypothetical protein